VHGLAVDAVAMLFARLFLQVYNVGVYLMIWPPGSFGFFFFLAFHSMIIGSSFVVFYLLYKRFGLGLTRELRVVLALSLVWALVYGVITPTF
jgi:hypothetical protein